MLTTLGLNWLNQKQIKSIQEYHILYILNIYEYTFKHEIKKVEINVDKASKY